jgi:hypothetical protein
MEILKQKPNKIEKHDVKNNQRNANLNIDSIGVEKLNSGGIV